MKTRMILERPKPERYKAEDWVAMAIVTLIALLIGCCNCRSAHADPDYQALANAIKITEGVPYYGIKSVHWKDYTEARQIAIRTARHAWRDYRSAMGLKTTKKGYIDFLANRYCPSSVDYKGNINWKSNMNRLYKGGI